MKNKLKVLAILSVIVALCGMPTPAAAQTTTYQTVLSAALTASATNMTVASTTNMQATGAASGPGGQMQTWYAWVDGELVDIRSINTTTNVVQIVRGKSPTRGTAHATASVVFFGPTGNTVRTGGTSPFTNQDLTPGSTCTATQFTFLPILAVNSGNLFNCLSNATGRNRWISYNFQQWAFGHPVVPVVDAAYTATLADEFITYVSLTSTRILTLPGITGVVGKTIIVTTNGTGTSSITITPQFNQTIGAGLSATLTQTNAGSVTRLISIINATGGYVWGTW